MGSSSGCFCRVSDSNPARLPQDGEQTLQSLGTKRVLKKSKKILHFAEIETPVLTGGMKPRDFQDGDANDTKDDIM